MLVMPAFSQAIWKVYEWEFSHYQRHTNTHLKNIAEQGDSHTQLSLGVRYKFGEQGSPIDKLEGLRCFRLAAEQGLPTAQFLYFYRPFVYCQRLSTMFEYPKKEEL